MIKLQPISFRVMAAACAALAVAGAVFYAWTVQRERTGFGEVPASAPGASVPQKESAASLAIATDQSSGRFESSTLSISSPMGMLDRASSTRNLDAELMRKAIAGDTEAMAAIIKLSSRCAPFWPSRGDRFHPRHSLADIPAGSTERLAREAALTQMVAYCDRPFAPNEAQERWGQFQQALKDAATHGDHAARAALGFEGYGEVEIISAMLEANEPWIVEAAMFAFAGSKDQLARQLDNEVFPSMIRATPSELSKIKWMAARWRACELGGACGPNQYDELNQCLLWGNCGLGLGVQAYIRNRELSAYQFELMQRYLAALDAKFKGGN